MNIARKKEIDVERGSSKLNIAQHIPIAIAFSKHS